jgi:hypothetical protein
MQEDNLKVEVPEWIKMFEIMLDQIHLSTNK